MRGDPTTDIENVGLLYIYDPTTALAGYEVTAMAKLWPCHMEMPFSSKRCLSQFDKIYQIVIIAIDLTCEQICPFCLVLNFIFLYWMLYGILVHDHVLNLIIKKTVQHPIITNHFGTIT